MLGQLKAGGQEEMDAISEAARQRSRDYLMDEGSIGDTCRFERSWW